MHFQVSNQARSNACLFHDVDGKVAFTRNGDISYDLLVQDGQVFPDGSLFINICTTFGYEGGSDGVAEDILSVFILCSESGRGRCINLDNRNLCA